jgi:hypothetical protein
MERFFMVKHKAKHKLRFSNVSNEVDNLSPNQRDIILYYLLGGISSSLEDDIPIDAEDIISTFEICLKVAKEADPKLKAPWDVER